MQVRLSYFRIDGSYLYDSIMLHEFAAQRDLVLHIQTQLNKGTMPDAPKDQLFYVHMDCHDGNRWSHPHLFLPVELAAGRPPEPLLGVARQNFKIDNIDFKLGMTYDFTQHVSIAEYQQLIQEGKVLDVRPNSG